MFWYFGVSLELMLGKQSEVSSLERRGKMFKIGTEENVIMACFDGLGGPVLPALPVRCPACDSVFSMQISGLRDARGRPRHCPYCNCEALMPAELPRFDRSVHVGSPDA